MNFYRHALAVLAVAICQTAGAQTAAVPVSVSASPANPTPSAEPRLIRGNDKVIAPATPWPGAAGTPSAFSFEETPVADVVRIVLGDILKVDYVLHPPLTGTVTLSTRDAVTPDQAVYLLESALQAIGLVLVRDARGSYHVGRPEAVKGVGSSTRQVASGSNLPPGYGAIIVPLQFIGANEMATILKPLMPADALVRADTVRNLLVLVGTRSQAEGWLDMVRTFDVDLLKGMSVGLFPLKYASVKEVEAALRLMAPGGAMSAPPSTTTTPSQRGQSGANVAATAAATLSESNPLHGALRIMPIERLNSILVVTPRAAYLDEARRWIERFDSPDDNSADAQLFVYSVQHGSAMHLAEVLGNVFGGATTTNSNASAGSGVAPRLNSSTAMGATSTSPFATGLGAAQNSGQSSPRSGAASVAATALGQGQLRVVADELNNAVLVYGTRSEYSRIEAALKRLDTPATQVLIEASIIEVTLTDQLKYGVQWMFTGETSDSFQGTGVLSGLANGLVGGPQAGFSYTLRRMGGVRAVLNALAGKTNLNVIASPSLMVLDNHTANLRSGTQQPVNIGSTVGLGGVVTPNIQYKDTGVALAVTPSVNAGDMVTMDINQSVIDVGASDTSLGSGNTGQPTFLQRQVGSKVSVRSGETIVLGGLIRDKLTTANSGVPGLHNIPLFGALFGTKEKSLDRTELLVVITPRVIRSDQAVREVGQELRDRMRGISSGLQEQRRPRAADPTSERQLPTQMN